MARKTTKDDKVILQFSGPYQRYAGGDIAGFDKAVADNILALKPPVAKVYDPKAADSDSE